jgi:hypothetical protein
MDRAGLYYLVTVYWIAYVCFYHNDKFEEAMGECVFYGLVRYGEKVCVLCIKKNEKTIIPA